ncbi:phosphoribosylaminoimidazolesuccinocarboxamide synthase [Anaerococcus porci]|uniref:phosphoribosylaminoimidazolesuccinocarboxamide synthase n=1 Tax=Anaerococcus porci TaxID=2652269 RepID=UPI002A763E50|nr:phosphoribosylaminoimidazolesuccinocarboxamide synthase [Anaerococcus porci]MDY3006675.1 phosphoribosylaminoimidazolesuccinocarboxamide synthase [Anaerococcus porci]
MNIIYKGKTKNLVESNGKMYCLFKDTMTGTDGVFDTGGNQVAGSKEGAGAECLKVSKFFFEKINQAGVKTHYLGADIDNNLMEIENCSVFGKGLEVITRFKAVGSFIRRYGLYTKEGQELNAYSEITLKDDNREDPLITKEGLVELNILSEDEYDEIIRENKKVAKLVKKILNEYGLELYDIKFEWGRHKDSGEVLLIDEVSGGNMRAYKDGKYIEPLELSRYLGL